jgi:hypothetical protein
MSSCPNISDMSIITIIISLQTLYFTFLNNIEVLTIVILLEDKDAFIQILNLKSINQLKLIILIQCLEQIHLFYELQFNIPSMDGTLDYDMLEHSSLNRPDHTFISCSYTSCTLLIIQECDLSKPTCSCYEL